MKNFKFLFVAFLVMTFAIANAAGLKKIKLIDQAGGGNKRIYCFETSDKQPADISALKAALTGSKHVLRVVIPGNDATYATRLYMDVDGTFILSKNQEFQKI